MISWRKLTLAVGLTLLAFSCQKDPVEELIVAAPDAALESSQAQDIRPCGMELHMQDLLKNPAFFERHQRRLDRIGSTIQTRSSHCQSPIVIPVAIHYQRLPGKNHDVQCLTDLAINQVETLNEDYSGTNFEIAQKWFGENIDQLFPGTNYGEVCVKFCIATKGHPDGYGLGDGDPAVTVNQTNGDFNSDWSGYLNVYVRNIQYLGYSPFGGSGNGDGVVIDDDAFGTAPSCGSVSPSAPYGLGRTLTHEIGHFFFLDHIWGSGCGPDNDDMVADTPESREPYGACPPTTAASCDSRDLHMNYMDYVYDECMYMFSAGQATRMEDYIARELGHMVTKGASVCEEGSGPPSSGDCTVPTSSNISVNRKKVTISWNGVSDTGFTVEYALQGSSNPTVATTSANSITLNGMKSGTYNYTVKANCDSNGAVSGSFKVD